MLLAARTASAAPHDFTADARALFDTATCGQHTDGNAAHCKQLEASIASWRAKWLDKAAPFFATLHGGAYPKTVVYPFGGGDLITLLAVYPDATEYTTLSLEGIGDPRPIESIKPADLTRALTKLRSVMAVNLTWAWNTTIELSKDSSESGASLPGILVQTLLGLRANGFEPLDVRYFRLDDKGEPIYVTDADLAAWDKAEHKSEHKVTNDLQQGLFDDVEIVFRKAGDANAPKRTFRHLAADLSDTGITAGTLAYLDKRTEISAMTKAASYLLWKDTFGKVRDYLLAHMQLMISDDTGIPPRFAKPAGFEQEVWGVYQGSHFSFANQDVAKEMVALWKGTHPALPFRFGYYDNHDHPHLLYTHKPPAK